MENRLCDYRLNSYKFGAKMGMYDNVYRVLVECPRCGNADPKSAQIKCGPQILETYLFGKDEIDVNWDYPYYDAIVDKEKYIIHGIATCDNCREESRKKMEYLTDEAKKKGEIKCPDDAKYLFECEIGGKSALTVILNRLDEAYGGHGNIELFHIVMWLKDNIAISAEVLDLDQK
jgi:hypothetical protein